ncbi:hypothetical protein H8A99_28925 [Bradyrhizobium sp. Arg68]|uniref:hypothetical protein n=1 Tax=Bradyrhizobium ivorense TaxID=2511166 RepID=UPI0027E25A7C|nr:hypothetical protein [Bradyrhizobium ivorense]MCC8940372.1 hypothetical protein [Bradyrhizobium ivorense]
MAGREYLNRQAATLLKFAQTTTDPTVAAGLVEKAADLKEQAEEPRAAMRHERPMLTAEANPSGLRAAKGTIM